MSTSEMSSGRVMQTLPTTINTDTEIIVAEAVR